MTKPFIIGLTGSIGMGKSTVGAMFEKHGVPVFDADAQVHRMQGPGGQLLETIEREFPGTTGPQGVDREKLGGLVFDDKEALTRLERIVHPAVAAERQAFLIEHARAPVVVFDIPLLFERGGHERVDAVVVVSAPPEVQRERVLARPGMTPEKFARILGLQMPDAEKRMRADYVIDTSGTLEQTERAVADLIARLSRSR
ncbi:MAG: dephospho-CoA kinase [Erythrobacter sp. RIFCSPHIGHO2_12_FULL_63_10]|nr:MAG: dephospho-CoA kinase [Erythrobacter sp. RIFCSPHIGHO2_12_FULL_63_10]